MVNITDVIKSSEAIASVSSEIQELKDTYAGYARDMSETMLKIKELEAKQGEMANELIKLINVPLTIDDLDD